MPFVRSNNGITTTYGVPLANVLGPGSAIYNGYPLPTFWVGNIPFGSGYSGQGTVDVVVSGGNIGPIITSITPGNGVIPSFWQWQSVHFAN